MVRTEWTMQPAPKLPLTEKTVNTALSITMLTVVSILAMPAQTFAQAATDPPKKSAARAVPLEDALKLAAIALEVPVIRDDSLVRGADAISWHGNADLSKLGSLDLWNEILKTRGLQLHAAGDGDTKLLILRPASLAQTRSQRPRGASSRGARAPRPEKPQARHIAWNALQAFARGEPDARVTTVMRPEHAQATDIVRPLANLGQGDLLRVDVARESNALLLTGAARDLVMASEILAAIDVPEAATRRTRAFIRIEHARADDLAAVVAEQVLVPMRGPRGPQAMQKDGERARITAHTASNTLIVFGTTEEIASAKEIVLQLDRPRETSTGKENPADDRVTMVWAVQNAKADEIGSVLQELLAMQSHNKRMRPAVSLIVNRSSNSLLVTGTKEAVNQLRKVFELLDRPNGKDPATGGR